MVPWSLVRRVGLIVGTCLPIWSGAAALGADASPTPTPSRYLSDTEPAYRHLARVQQYEAEALKKAFPDFRENVELPFDLREQDFRAIGGTDAELKAMRDTLADESKKPLPTRYENPRLYMQVRRILDKLHAVAPSFVDGPPPTLRVGTLLSLEAVPQPVFSEAVPVPQSDQYVVVMNRFLFTIIHELTKLSFDSLKSGATASDLTGRLLVLVDSFNNNKGRMPPLARPDSRDEVALIEPIVETLELFVLAHEYVHVMRKHEFISTAQIDLSQEGSSLLKLKASEHSWRQEIEADVVGYRMVLRSFDLAQRAPGSVPRELDQLLRQTPRALFVYLGILEEAKQICRDLDLNVPDRKTREATVSIVLGALRSDPSAPAPKTDAGFDVSKLPGHPPLWARLQLVQTAAELEAWQRSALERSGGKQPEDAALRENQQKYADLGQSMLVSLSQLWGRARLNYLKSCMERAKHQPPAGR